MYLYITSLTPPAPGGENGSKAAAKVRFSRGAAPRPRAGGVRVSLCVLLMTLLLAQSALAQDYSIPWYSIDGGATSTSAKFTLRGVIGQPDAGVLSSSVAILRGGFVSYPAPVIVSPSDEAPLLNFFETPIVTLTWNPLDWAQAYHVQVSPNLSFSTLVFEDSAIPATSDRVDTTALSSGRYYWRVRAQVDTMTWGAWSQSAGFVVDLP